LAIPGDGVYAGSAEPAPSQRQTYMYDGSSCGDAEQRGGKARRG
jgi:hypothetical protein